MYTSNTDDVNQESIHKSKALKRKACSSDIAAESSSGTSKDSSLHQGNFNFDILHGFHGKQIGRYTPEERLSKILKYKAKLRRRREKVPVSRVFTGRSVAAKVKFRKDGKFSALANKKSRVQA